MADDGLRIVTAPPDDDGLRVVHAPTAEVPGAPRVVGPEASTGDPVIDAMLAEAGNAAGAAMAQMGRGEREFTTPSATSPFGQPARGALDYALGALQLLGSPAAPLFAGPAEGIDTLVGKPVEKATGIPSSITTNTVLGVTTALPEVAALRAVPHETFVRPGDARLATSAQAPRAPEPLDLGLAQEIREPTATGAPLRPLDQSAKPANDIGNWTDRLSHNEVEFLRREKVDPGKFGTEQEMLDAPMWEGGLPSYLHDHWGSLREDARTALSRAAGALHISELEDIRDGVDPDTGRPYAGSAAQKARLKWQVGQELRQLAAQRSSPSAATTAPPPRASGYTLHDEPTLEGMTRFAVKDAEGKVVAHVAGRIENGTFYVDNMGPVNDFGIIDNTRIRPQGPVRGVNSLGPTAIRDLLSQLQAKTGVTRVSGERIGGARHGPAAKSNDDRIPLEASVDLVPPREPPKGPRSGSLEDFMASDRQNAILDEPGFENLYVRRGRRLLNGRERSVLDLPNVTATGDDPMAALRFFQRAFKTDVDAVYAENLMNPRLEAALKRAGFEEDKTHISPYKSYFKLTGRKPKPEEIATAREAFVKEQERWNAAIAPLVQRATEIENTPGEWPSALAVEHRALVKQIGRMAAQQREEWAKHYQEFPAEPKTASRVEQEVTPPAEPPKGPPPGKPPAPGAEPPPGRPPQTFMNVLPDSEGGITSDYLRSLEDQLFTDQQASHADMLEVVQNLKQAPEALRDPKLQEKFYHYIEWLRGYEQADEAMRVAGPEFQASRHHVPDVTLTPEERALFNEHLEDLKRIEARLGKRAMDYGFEDVDLNYMHRRAKGHTPELDRLLGQDTPSPQLGRRGLPTKTSSMKERKYFALQAPDGSRRVVSKGPDGIAIWQNNKPFPFRVKGTLKPHRTVIVDGKPFLVTEARTTEIEQHTPVRYYKNALANTLDNVVKLRRVNRNIERLEQIKSTPEWQRNAARVDENGDALDGRDIPPTWRTSKLPQMAGWAMDRRLADIFDDLAGHEFNTMEEALAAINKVTIGSLFITPVPHLMNVLSHWYVSRGWDNYTPMGLKSIVGNSAKAWKAVVEKDETYRRYLRAGGGLIDAGLANKQFYQNMLKIFGEAVERDVKQYGELGPMGKVARIIGYDKVHDFVAAFYNVSNRALWMGNDMFMIQRYLEQEQLHGRSTPKAISETEKHIPNYRLPSRVGLGANEATYKGGRAFVQATRHPFFEFSRYHYGMWKSIGYMIRDMREGLMHDPKLAWETTGHMVALGAFMTFIGTAVSSWVKWMTDNPDAKMDQPGAGRLPQGVLDFFNGDKDSLASLFNMFTLAPLPREMLQLGFGHDLYSGKDVAPSAGLRGDAQLADHALNTLFYPYGLASKAVQGDDDLLTNSLKEILESSFMIKDPPEGARTGKARAKQKKMYLDLWRRQQPRGPLEALTDQ